MYRIISFFSLFLLFNFTTFSQTDTTTTKASHHFSAFVDVFYAFDFNRPEASSRQAYFFNHNRHNEFNLNMGLVNWDVRHARYRATLGLHTGVYSIDNYALEPSALRYIYEAYAGLSLNAASSLWLDAGIFNAPIGFESAPSIDNWTLTRSLLAEHSPYYLAGARLSYSPNDTWYMAAVVCNGWQRIQRLQGNSLPSLSTQLTCTPSEKVTINWSTFVGTDSPDSLRLMRYFNNFFAKLEVSERLGLILGFDIGIQQQAPQATDFDSWISPILITRLKLDQQWYMAFRAELFNDPGEVIIPTNTPNGFDALGFSVNLDYMPVDHVACRLEARWLNSQDEIYVGGEGLNSTNLAVVSSIAIRFGK